MLHQGTHTRMSTPPESSARPASSAPLLGFWYPATLAIAVRPGKMRAQVLLGLPLLICRDSQGRLAALRDICPHRGMPLSFGHFDGTILECCYHGWQFDMEGRCRHIPALVAGSPLRSEEHTSELQSQSNLVCRLLLEKKKENGTHILCT